MDILVYILTYVRTICYCEFMESLLRINEVSELLNVHPKTIQRWDIEGKIQCVP